MTVPSTLARSRSVDAKHHYQKLLQLQNQQQLPALDPTTRFARTATAPTGLAAAPAALAAAPAAQSLIREALALDKLFDAACTIIESIWPNHSASQSMQLCSLRCFVAETYRQSRLAPDALELSIFYLMRAKMILEAKQRAEQQHQQRLLEEEMQKRQQELLLLSAESTPPLSPASPGDARRLPAAAALMVVPGAHRAGLAAAVPSGGIASPLGSSPVTPAAPAAMDKHQQHQLMLASGIITPVTPDKARRLMAAAGGCGAVPLRGLVVVPAASAAAAAAAAAAHPQQQQQQKQPPAQPPRSSSVAKCGRRMFVAALISASKFMFDQTYSNKAWNRITKLPPQQICEMERAFLDMIDYQLYVDRATYDGFHRMLARSGARNTRLATHYYAAAAPRAPAADPDIPGARLIAAGAPPSYSPQTPAAASAVPASAVPVSAVSASAVPVSAVPAAIHSQ